MSWLFFSVFFSFRLVRRSLRLHPIWSFFRLPAKPFRYRTALPLIHADRTFVTSTTSDIIHIFLPCIFCCSCYPFGSPIIMAETNNGYKFQLLQYLSYLPPPPSEAIPFRLSLSLKHIHAFVHISVLIVAYPVRPSHCMRKFNRNKMYFMGYNNCLDL